MFISRWAGAGFFMAVCFFKQKTAYEMRISDWSSDVCSSDLVPVLGVPVQSAALSGVDSLYSIVQMPGGIPVATFAIGKAGATNAALFAAALLANEDTALADRLVAWRETQTNSVAPVPVREG